MNTMGLSHPLLLALKMELENNRTHINEEPRGTIELILPIPVLTRAGTFSYMAGVNNERVLVFIGHLSALDTAYTSNHFDLPCKQENF